MNQVFQTGAFGISNMFSTPCDASPQEYCTQRRASMSQLHQNTEDSTTRSNVTANNQAFSFLDEIITDDKHDQIYMSYSKIWKDSTSQDGQTSTKYQNGNSKSSRTMSTNSNLDSTTNYSSFSQALQTQFGSYSNQKSEKEKVELSTCLDTKQIKEELQRMIGVFQESQKENGKGYAQIVANRIIQSYQVYSIKVNPHNIPEKTNQQNPFRNTPLQEVTNSFQNRCSSNSNSPFLVQNLLQRSQKQDQVENLSTNYVPIKGQSRQHLIQNVRQPQFIKNNDELICVQMKQKSSFDFEDYSLNLNKNSFKHHDSKSQNTLGMASQSTSTKEEHEHFDNSFDEEFYLDLQQVNLLDEE